jgi:hypothetical protein
MVLGFEPDECPGSDQPDKRRYPDPNPRRKDRVRRQGGTDRGNEQDEGGQKSNLLHENLLGLH